MLDFKTCIEYYKKHKEEVLYLFFGFLTTIIYLGSFKIFLIFGIHYIISTNIAFVLAVLFAFFTNRHLVFKKGSNVFREIALFFAARIATQLINNVGLILAVEVLYWDAFISQIILTVIVTILNYIISKYAIFI